MKKTPQTNIKSFVIRSRSVKENALMRYKNNFHKFLYPLTHDKLKTWILNKKHLDINLEIGFGMSDSIVYNSKTHKNKKFIGIEVLFKGIVRTVNTLLLHEGVNDNVILFNNDCKAVLEEYIEENMLDTVVSLFPDPWPKKKHHKRRLFSMEILRLINRKLKIGGKFYFRSDNENYFDCVLNKLSIMKEFKLIDFDNFYKTLDIRRSPFQEKAEKTESKIYTICAEKIIIL